MVYSSLTDMTNESEVDLLIKQNEFQWKLIKQNESLFKKGEAEKAPAIIALERTLQLAAEKYKENTDSPEYLSEFYQALWNLYRVNMGLSSKDVEVVSSTYTKQDLNDLRQLKVPELCFYLPQIVSTAPEGLVLLGKAFPFMLSWSLQENTSVRNVNKQGQTINQYGWMSVEAVVNAPYTETTQEQLEDIFKNEGRVGQTLNVYAASSQAIKNIYDQYPDEIYSYVRLLGSEVESRVMVSANFFPNGCLNVGFDSYRYNRWSVLGGRSVRLKT